MQRRSQTNIATKTGAQALRTMDALLKPTEWEKLADAERAQAAAPFAALRETATRGAAILRASAPVALQDWIASLTSRVLQPYVAAGVASWLATAPENAHLYVGGSASLGTPQLVASVARQNVANWPTPSSYCYVPDPTSLNQPRLLPLPLGTSDAFTQTLSDALRTISKGWDDAASRPQTINALFDTLRSAAPAPGQTYLDGLRTALLQLVGPDAAFPWAGDDSAPPLGSVTPEPSVTSGAPVVEATDPSGSLTDVLLQANGGVLIVSPATIDIGKLLPLLVARELTLQDGLPPLPLDVRVVLVGSGDAYDSLWSNSDTIAQIFRYELWSQDIVTWNRDAEATYAALFAGVAQYYGLPAPSPAAVGRLIQEGSRRADGLNRQRLIGDLLVLHDIIVEAGKAARNRAATTIAGEDVDAILNQRRAVQRANIFWVQSGILAGESITPTAGVAVGQINGLGVLEVHPSEGTFAVPMRISATVVPAKGEQLLDIEREAAQTDESHVRGLLTMEGYFANQYGQRYLLALAARIRFEQEQGGTGGDSASAAELFTLLSALSGIPLRRSIAVTGAVGQYGEIQPIGGVNYKIEGFWDLCRIRRQQGEQADGGYGVLMPASNAGDLMLHSAVAESILTEGWFSVYLADTIDDALPVVMGVPAAEVHDRVERRLRAYALLQRKSR